MRITTRICSFLLALLLLTGLAPAIHAAVPDPSTFAELPYNVETPVGEGAYLKFVAPETGSYSFYKDNHTMLNVIEANNNSSSSLGTSIGIGYYNRYYKEDSSLRYFPLIEGKTYYVYSSAAGNVRVISLKDQIAQARQNGAPVLTTENSVTLHYDGTEASATILFTPALTAQYDFTLTSYLCLDVFGEEGVAIDFNSSSSVYSAKLLGGQTYILYGWNSNETSVDTEVHVTQHTKTDFTSVTRNEDDLENGPLRYTVLILQGNHLSDEMRADQKAAARRFCEEMAQESGESYVAIVGTMDRTLILWEDMTPNQSIWRPYTATDRLFSADLDVLSQRIDMLEATDSRKTDLFAALEVAEGLLDAAVATYGDRVETNIVVFSDGELSNGTYCDRGPYTRDGKPATEWGAGSSFYNAVYRYSQYIKEKYDIYTLALNGERWIHSFLGSWLISDEAVAFLRMFLRDISSGKDFNYEWWGEDGIELEAENIANAICTGEHALPLPFSDVQRGDWFCDAVLWAVNAEPQITNGTSATTFSPGSTCTRGQVVTFLWRAKGCPEPTSTVNPFTDVKESDYFYKAVLWAKETGVTSGTSATTFSPGNGCTRAQVVTFLWRSEGKPQPASTSNPFNDVPAGQYYTDAVLWAVENGITNGTSATAFSPDKTCTRGQIVTFLYRDLA